MKENHKVAAPFASLHKQNLETAMSLARLSVDNAQKMLQLQLTTSKALFEAGVSNVQALAQVKTPQEAMALRANFTQHAAEQFFSASHSLMEITSQLQGELSRLSSEQFKTASQESMHLMQGFMQSMPRNSHAAADVMQTAFDTARNTLERVAEASRQALSTATKR